MFYLEDENTDFIVGDPLEIDTFFWMADGEKEKAEDKYLATEESDPESTEGEENEVTVAEVAEEEAEAKIEKAVVEESAVEEAPAEKETPVEEASVEATEEASADEVVEEVAESKEEEPAEESPDEEKDEEPAKSKIDPEEAAYVAQQTNIVQATYFDLRKDLPKFRSGDKISVGYRVIEGGRTRIQNFDGVVIKISAGHGVDKTFTVRKVSGGIGVERIFPFHSPNIQSIKVLKEGKVRRAKLYYLRSRVGKATRIKERTSK